MSHGLRLSVLVGEASLIHTINQIQASCQQCGFPGPTPDELSLSSGGGAWRSALLAPLTPDPELLRGFRNTTLLYFF